MNTVLLLVLVFLPYVFHALFLQFWKKRWSCYAQKGIQRSTTAMKGMYGPLALVAIARLAANLAVVVWYWKSEAFDAHWLGWVFAMPLLLHAFYEGITGALSYVIIATGPKAESGLFRHERDRVKAGQPIHNTCYVCQKNGHRREMVLLGQPGSNELGVEIARDPKKAWSPTQGCFQCGKCGRLVCYTHSDVDMQCDCGARDWRKRSYLQQELDNGEETPSLRANAQRQPSGGTTKSGLEAFFKGLLENDLKLVKQGIQMGVDVNMLLGDGGETTPLVFSAHKGNYDVCRELLEAGATPNQRNKRGHLALCEVLANTSLSVSDRIKVATLLLEQGADPNGLDWGRPAIQFALESEQFASLLLAHGANVNQVSEYHELAGPRPGENFQYHENAIRYACKIGAMPDVTQVLLAAGADPLVPNSEGDTAWDFVNNFLQKAPNEPISNGREGAEKRMALQARVALYEETVKLLKPVVMAARFNLFVSYDKGSGWGEFFRGRLERVGRRIWSSDLLKRRLPYYEEVLEAHVANAHAAVLFLSPMHFDTGQGDKERRRELDALLRRFSSMPDKLLVVTTSDETTDLLASHSELRTFPSFHLAPGAVNEMWVMIESLCGAAGSAGDIFADLREITKPACDCFVSYRTVSVQTVRFIAEQLVARGAKLWFAEWEIMVSGRRDFQESINHGIASSSKVICCTNSGYAQSEYCQIEAMQVLDVPGKESRHILDLRIPDEPNAVSEALQKHGSESVVHDEQTMLKTWESCCRFLGVQDSNLPERANYRTPRHFEVAGTPFHMAMDAKWEVRPVGKQIRGGNTVIAFFSQNVGSVTLEGELVVGPWAISLPGQADINDREMFEAIISTIREWNRHGKILYPRGVHVVHVPALHDSRRLIAHPAFTYLDPGTQSGEQDKGLKVPLSDCTWHRKYCIRVAPPHMPSEMEFCFDFDMRGVAHDDFATFCRYAYLMDDLVRWLGFE